MAKTNKVRVGLIGCGGISKSHLAGLSQFEDVELVGFCDVIVERAEKHVAKYGGKAFDDAAKMLADVKPDAAYILIPTYAHGTPERACLKAGVPFLVEKPMGMNAEDLRKLSKEVQASGLINSSGFMNRYQKSVNHAKEILASDPAILLNGAWVGGPPLVRPGDYFADQTIGQWWPIKEKSGGQFVEQVIHTVDIVRYLAGEVVEVSAMAANGFNKKLDSLIPKYNLDDAMVVSMRFESGAVANIMSCCAAGAEGGVFLNVWAAHNTIKFDGWGHDAKIYREGETGYSTIPTIADIFGVEDRAFINAVKHKSQSFLKSTHAEAVRTTLVALAANESLETCKSVTVRY